MSISFVVWGILIPCVRKPRSCRVVGGDVKLLFGKIFQIAGVNSIK